ncbi:sugar transferase [Rhodobacteraceae bacterium CCMM004]|nr:sugar transferase [Rhodobacteraceae bacterium CCMM004]
MTWGKRIFDLVLLALMGVVLLPATMIVAAVLWATQGRPLLYKSERMKAPGQAFQLWKFRTMTDSRGDAGVTGGDKSARITPAGRILRRTRLDELPQMWNVLRGDISFVGPRPPLREYVERFPEVYAEVLKSRPGITGLATLRFHRHEERLLAACDTPAETDAVYCRRCIPRKAALDILYRRHRSLCFDLVLMAETAGRVVGRKR